MTRYVITPDVAIQLAEQKASIATGTHLLAPTLMRSQVLSLLYRQGREGEISKSEATTRLGYIRGLRIRLLGDRVLQRLAWTVAAELGWPDTFDAEHIALTKLQADALVTSDSELSAAASAWIPKRVKQT
jgi:predicted nucleic acid-binding protein